MQGTVLGLDQSPGKKVKMWEHVILGTILWVFRMETLACLAPEIHLAHYKQKCGELLVENEPLSNPTHIIDRHTGEYYHAHSTSISVRCWARFLYINLCFRTTLRVRWKKMRRKDVHELVQVTGCGSAWMRIWTRVYWTLKPLLLLQWLCIHERPAPSTVKRTRSNINKEMGVGWDRAANKSRHVHRGKEKRAGTSRWPAWWGAHRGVFQTARAARCWVHGLGSALIGCVAISLGGEEADKRWKAA